MHCLPKASETEVIRKLFLYAVWVVTLCFSLMLIQDLWHGAVMVALNFPLLPLGTRPALFPTGRKGATVSYTQ